MSDSPRNNNKPLVSVIIPAYNAERLVLQTVQSALGQTYPAVEIVVVNDGSKDNTEGVLKPFADAGKIVCIRQENQGQAAVRKNGFLASKGKYISFLDADDLIPPEKIAIQTEYMEANPDCGVCYSDIYHFWHHEPSVMLKKKLEYHSGYIFNKLIKNNVIQVMTALIRRDALEKYGVPGAEFRRSDDWYLWLNLAYNGVKFCFLDKVLAFQRRQREGTLSDQRTYFKETAETNLRVYDHYSKILSEEEKKKYDLQGLINFWYYRLAIGHIILGDRVSAKSALAQFKSSGAKDRIKKLFLNTIITIVPARLLGNLILMVREWRKRSSFEIVKHPQVLPPGVSV
ncbi:MAG: glycosyltransferase family 2 protein [Candidatus Liptonbacteria bacterium]